MKFCRALSVCIIANEPSLDALDSYNDCTKGFQKQVAEAIATTTPFRSLGAGWSWTKILRPKTGSCWIPNSSTLRFLYPSKALCLDTQVVLKTWCLHNAATAVRNWVKSCEPGIFHWKHPVPVTGKRSWTLWINRVMILKGGIFVNRYTSNHIDSNSLTRI